MYAIIVLIQKFDMESTNALGTPMCSTCSLEKNDDEKPMKESKYKGMINYFLYLTTSQPNILFSVFRYARYQSASKESHLIVVKRII